MFWNIAIFRLINKLLGGKVGPRTLHVPSGEEMSVFEAANRYKRDKCPVVILAGKEYGSGSSRDSAAKGPFLLVGFLQWYVLFERKRHVGKFKGVKAVLAESFERIHRSNLIGMGILPLQYTAGQSATSLKLTGKERFSVKLPEKLAPSMNAQVQVQKIFGKIQFLLIYVNRETFLQDRHWSELFGHLSPGHRGGVELLREWRRFAVHGAKDDEKLNGCFKNYFFYVFFAHRLLLVIFYLLSIAFIRSD